MRLFLFPTVEAPGEARRGLAPLSKRVDTRSFDDLRTVVSELVTISVAHGATEAIGISVTLVDGEIECVVFDHGPGTEAIVRAREQDDSSLVLQIIDALVDDWGTNPGRTRVWFRMRVDRP